MRKTYVIGDVQGCLEPLKQLLQKIHYDPMQDTLWFTGDLANRGPEPLATLRFIYSLPPSTICVLGNHDLALLATAEGIITPSKEDTHSEILEAPDKALLLDWLRHRPLFHHDPIAGFTLTHAGIYPGWDLSQAKSLAQEVEQMLRGEQYHAFLQNIYGNDPVHWDNNLTGWDRLRFIVNALTRMRFCTAEGALALEAKGPMAAHPDFIPWFALQKNKQAVQPRLVFGHWAALENNLGLKHIVPLDSGCVWGNSLTAFCLETQQYISIDCHFRFTANQGKVRAAGNAPT